MFFALFVVKKHPRTTKNRTVNLLDRWLLISSLILILSSRLRFIPGSVLESDDLFCRWIWIVLHQLSDDLIPSPD